MNIINIISTFLTVYPMSVAY